MSSIRILVADNHADWRRQVRRLLETRSNLRVVSEVADGPEAVRKAEEVKPELVLLDLGLPMLNGIEAARQIRSVSRESRIIFLSEDNSPDIVQEALTTGALGYIYKLHVVRQLLPTIDAVLRDKQCVSSSLKGYEFPEPGPVRPCRHEVEFYSNDASFVDSFAQLVAGALTAGTGAVVIATSAHLKALHQALRSQPLDICAAIESGRFLELEAHKALSTFMLGEMPDERRFFDLACRLFGTNTKACGGRSRVAACSECTSLLWAQGRANAAIRLERLWDELTKTYDVDILCGYSFDVLHGETGRNAFTRIGTEHTSIRQAESRFASSAESKQPGRN